MIILQHRKYNFKAKKRKVANGDDDHELEESVRIISALFGQSENGIAPSSTDFGLANEPLEARVASISAEIAAAIAQAQAQARHYEDEEGEDGEESELETIGPNTSGIRG